MESKKLCSYALVVATLCMSNFHDINAEITIPKENGEENNPGALSLTSPVSYSFANGDLTIFSRYEDLQCVVIDGIEYSVSGRDYSIEISLTEGEYLVTIITESHSYEGNILVE